MVRCLAEVIAISTRHLVCKVRRKGPSATHKHLRAGGRAQQPQTSNCHRPSHITLTSLTRQQVPGALSVRTAEAIFSGHAQLSERLTLGLSFKSKGCFDG